MNNILEYRFSFHTYKCRHCRREFHWYLAIFCVSVPAGCPHCRGPAYLKEDVDGMDDHDGAACVWDDKRVK